MELLFHDRSVVKQTLPHVTAFCHDHDVMYLTKVYDISVYAHRRFVVSFRNIYTYGARLIAVYSTEDLENV